MHSIEYRGMINFAAEKAGLMPTTEDGLFGFEMLNSKLPNKLQLYDIRSDDIDDQMLYVDLSNTEINFTVPSNDESIVCIIYVCLNPTYAGQLPSEIISEMHKKLEKWYIIRHILRTSYVMLKYYSNKEEFTRRVIALFGEEINTYKYDPFIYYNDDSDSDCERNDDSDYDSDYGVRGSREYYEYPVKSGDIDDCQDPFFIEGYSGGFNKYWGNINSDFINPFSVFYEGTAEEIISFYNNAKPNGCHRMLMIIYKNRGFTIPLNAINLDDKWIYLVACGLLSPADVIQLSKRNGESLHANETLLKMINEAQKVGMYDDIDVIFDFQRSEYVLDGKIAVVNKCNICAHGDQHKIIFQGHCDEPKPLMLKSHNKWVPNDIPKFQKLTRFGAVYGPVINAEQYIVHDSFRAANGGNPYLVLGNGNRDIIIMSSDTKYKEIEYDVESNHDKWLYYDYLMRSMILRQKAFLMWSMRIGMVSELANIVIQYV